MKKGIKSSGRKPRTGKPILAPVIEANKSQAPKVTGLSSPSTGARNASGRDCARVSEVWGYTLPRARALRGVATPIWYSVELFAVSQTTPENLPKGLAPVCAIKDCTNLRLLQGNALSHTALRSIAVCLQRTKSEGYYPVDLELSKNARFKVFLDAEQCLMIVCQKV